MTRSTTLLRAHPSLLLLILLILSYILYFSWYTINRHNTLNSYAADLSLIDQPMWNTVRGPGGFLELTWGKQQQPRLAEHFEPILIPLALLFFVWDDVRILLIAQSVALALGALPVFWIARSQLNIKILPFGIHNWSALIFAAVYLLSPQLQAANIADFHADPFVLTPLLFAFWYASQKRWGWMWLWTVVVMATKETLPTLTAMLGLWLVMSVFYGIRQNRLTADGRAPNATPNTAVSGQPSTPPQVTHGLTLCLFSMLWFLVGTFLIVAPLARQYFGTDGPIYLANRYDGGLAGLPSLLQDPARWRYLFGLLASVGFLPLLAPDLLLIGLPVLVANLLSNFPGQYSGEQHYSAPLVAVLIIAAIYATRRLIRLAPPQEVNGQSLKTAALIGAMLWLGSWTLGYHALFGWTPLSARMEIYRPSPATSRLSNFAVRIPPGAIVSASAAIHPHLAHRRVIYVFPTVQEADALLVDITDIPGVHPNDARSRLLNMLDEGWQLLAADYGLILAQKGTADSTRLPDAFFDFARTTGDPTYSTPLTIGNNGQLQLLGYDLLDDPDDGVTFRFYWRALEPLAEDLRLWPLVYDDLGQLLSDPNQVPMIAALWYPPVDWQADEIIVTETLPHLLPDTFHLGVAVGPEGSLVDPAQRYPITTTESTQSVWRYPGHWAQLASFERQGPWLSHIPTIPTRYRLTLTDARFGPAIHLTGYWFDPLELHAGQPLPMLLQWKATRPPAKDYSVFVHLLAPDGSLVTQNDAFPTWLTPVPTSSWPIGQLLLDSHTLAVPNDLPPNRYLLQVGLYDPKTLERLSMPDGKNSFFLGEIEVK